MLLADHMIPQNETQDQVDSAQHLTFGEETLILTRRWGHETRRVAMQLLDQNQTLVEIGQQLGREPADVLNFAIRCAPKLRELEPDQCRAKLLPTQADLGMRALS
jgi:hypothetical protein